MKEIRKQKKKRRKGNKNMEKDPGDPIRPTP
jgi:hypothetical protein